MEHESLNKTEEPWHNWRTMAGYVYLTICIFDFLIMPAAIQINHVGTKEVLVELLANSDKQFVIDIQV